MGAPQLSTHHHIRHIFLWSTYSVNYVKLKQLRARWGLNGWGDEPKTFPVVHEEAAVKVLECIALQQLNETMLFGRNIHWAAISSLLQSNSSSVGHIPQLLWWVCTEKRIGLLM